MAQGFQHGAVCHETMQQAAQAACSAFGGTTSGGLFLCSATEVHSSVATLHFTQITAEGSKPFSVQFTPQSCEYPTWGDTYLPLLGAMVPLLFLVWVGRRVVELFKSEKENV